MVMDMVKAWGEAAFLHRKGIQYNIIPPWIVVEEHKVIEFVKENWRHSYYSWFHSMLFSKGDHLVANVLL